MNILRKISSRLSKYSPLRFKQFLIKEGIQIGEGTYFQSPRTTTIDLTRPSLISIGKNCFFNNNFTALTHDWVAHVFINSGKDFVNSCGRITIGNNVSFGQNVTILKNVSIGDNCFIGANSIVTKNIPANSVAAGCPCRVIMSLDEYYKKRLLLCEAEALDYAKSIVERFGRKPEPKDFWEEFPLFVSGFEMDKYPNIPFRRQLGPIYDKYKSTHIAKYKNFDEFLNVAGI